MNDQRLLHFSIGPVQDFVAQARRTRDLLAGSFLLSYLSGCAMAYITEHKGKIVFPRVHEDPLVKAIRKSGLKEPHVDGPWIGSLPNRFTASIPEDFRPEACEKAVLEAWERIADAVWKRFVARPASAGKNTREIWERQVKNWWEITWVVADSPSQLNYRKYWRSYLPTDEPGDKCMLISRLQELSGYVRAKERKKQSVFWRCFKDHLGQTHALEIKEETERLSAIGTIKRLFPRVTQEAIGWKWTDHAVSFPSVYHLSAHSGMKQALHECPDLAVDFAKKAREYGILKSPAAKNHFPNLRAEAEKAGAEAFLTLDAKAFYPNELDKLIENDKQAREDLKKHLDALNKQLGKPFANYYALLVMDGDKLGDLLQALKDTREEWKVSQALSVFSLGDEKEPGLADYIRDRYDGVTIYAGGDDLMAMFPLDQAIPAAVDLSKRYKKAFEKVFSKDHIAAKTATGSAAILFAHYKVPLKEVVKEGHRLLDDVAKSGTGRDSLAVGVWTSSGIATQWSAPWEHFVLDWETNRTVFDDIRESLQKKDDPLLSNSFLYKLSMYESLLENQVEAVLDRKQVKRLLISDYVRILGDSGKWTDEKKEKIEEQMDRLLQVCFVVKRSMEGDTVRLKETNEFKADGAILAKFLAQKGFEKDA